MTDFTITSGGTYANGQTARTLFLRGGENYAGGTNTNGGHVYVYGGIGSGTGKSGNVLLGTDASTARGNVGIGMAAPQSLLHVASSGYPQFEKSFAGAPT